MFSSFHFVFRLAVGVFITKFSDINLLFHPVLLHPLVDYENGIHKSELFTC